MSEHQLILYDDAQARSWFPFTTTRPAGELRFGALTLRARAERALGARCLGHITDPILAGFEEPDAAPVLDLTEVNTSNTRIFLCSRAVLATSARVPGTAGYLRIGSDIVGLVCAPGSPNPTAREFVQPPPGPVHEIHGAILDNVWELVTRNREQLQSDIEQLSGSAWSAVPPGVSALGQPRLHIGRDVALEPGVVLDFRSGPIRLDDGVEIRAFTRLAGPAHIGTGTTLLGGNFTAVSIGPHCKVRGEMEETVIVGYSNKAHDGFLGHAYLGCWVNLGANTTNSDLKNNYGSVKLRTPAGEVDTTELKIGCFLGDHVKTAIGCLINTGTMVGAGSNLFGGTPPKYVPPFSWGVQLGEYDFARFAATAQAAMARRSVQLTDGHRRMLQRVWKKDRAAGGVWT
jgi:UDP-N-acetylglucosamine diphosphorylase/glucosamine-1-phosphate N-acetyltransferase